MTASRVLTALRRSAVALTVVAGPAGPGVATPQTSAPATPAVQTPANPQQATAPPQAETYRYNPEGRRDPFLSLVNRGTTPALTSLRPAGLAGFLISEVTPKGIIQDREAPLAMLQTADGKTYLVRANDRLFDGTVKEIMTDAVIFSQEVNDPLSLDQQRDVRKPLRPMEEGK